MPTQVYSTAGLRNWTVPSGVTSVDVQCWGSGGRGGNNSTWSGGGGGGGAYAAKTGITVTPAASIACVIGTPSGVDAQTPSTTFNGVTVVAAGGWGTEDHYGGARGKVEDSTGTTKYDGGDGGEGNYSTGNGGGGGAGGPSGAGAAGTNVSYGYDFGGAGGAGNNGSGGSGGTAGTNRDGGDGGANVLGGGGGGGGADNYTGGDGGACGGGGGGSDHNKAQSAGGVGRIVITWETPNDSPTAPTSLQCEGATNPQAITDLTPEFSAIFNDPDSVDTSTKFEVEVNAAVGFGGTVMWDSGYLTITSVDEGDRCAVASYAGTALELDGTTYYWRCRFQDYAGEDGPWSATGNFRMKNEVDMEIDDSVSASDIIALQKALGLQCNESLSVSTSNLQSLAKAFPEILAMADSIDFISAFVRSYGEEIGLSDALLNKISKVVVEDIALAGSISRAITAIMTGDTLGLADSTSFDTIREITESLSLSDQMATIILFTRQVEETFSLNDTVATATLKALRETMPVADALVREISIARAEGLSITAALDKVAGLTRALAETLVLDSEFLLHTIRDMFISESLGLADQYAHVWAASKLFAETLALTDEKRMSRLLVRVESLGLTDQALFISQIYRSMTDIVGMADSITVAVGKALADTLPFADAIGKAVSIVRSDALAIDDDLVSALARTISDQFNLDDEYVRVFIKNVLLLENLAVTGTADSVTVVSKIVAETLTVSDAAQFQAIIERVETLALGEQAAFIYAYRRAVADTVGLDESITRTMQKALSDTLVVASALVRDLTAGKTFAEVIALDAESIRAVAKVIADQFDLSAEFIEETAKYIIALETLALSGEMVKAVTAQRILSELFKVGDRLRLKGMWDDPNIKVIVSMLRASMITTRLR